MFKLEFNLTSVKISQLQAQSIDLFKVVDYDCRVIVDYKLELDKITHDLAPIFWNASTIKVYNKPLNYNEYVEYNERLIKGLELKEYTINSAFTNKQGNYNYGPRINFNFDIDSENATQFIDLMLDITKLSKKDFKEKEQKGGKIWYSC